MEVSLWRSTWLILSENQAQSTIKWRLQSCPKDWSCTQDEFCPSSTRTHGHITARSMDGDRRRLGRALETYYLLTQIDASCSQYRKIVNNRHFFKLRKCCNRNIFRLHYLIKQDLICFCLASLAPKPVMSTGLSVIISHLRTPPTARPPQH